MEQITQGAAKKRILEILLDFSKYCDENKLQYYPYRWNTAWSGKEYGSFECHRRIRCVFGF